MDAAHLARMGADELDGYARMLGIDAREAKGAEAKAALIERRRSRVASVRVLGMDVEIPVKRAKDKRAVDLAARAGEDDGAAEAFMRLMLGDEQWEAVVRACTDEDGTVDVCAMALAYAQVSRSPELKNF